MTRWTGSGVVRWLKAGVSGLGWGLGLALGSWGAAQAAPTCPPELKPPSAAQLDAARAQASDRGFLWRMKKGGRVSYLYGTLHVGRLGWVFPGPTLQQAIDASEVVALELDMQDPVVQAGMQQAMASGTRTEPLPADLARRLQAQLKLSCLSSQQQTQLLTAYSPEMVLVTLTLLSARRDGLEAAYAVDLMLSRLGHLRRKTMVSLEDPAAQLALLRADTSDELREGLDLGLTGLENQSARRGMKRVAGVWAESRFDELARYSEWCECMDTPAQREQMKKLLDDRNLVMADRIDALHVEGKRVFAAVGSLHMVGPLGLPALMGRRGYEVERVEFAAPRR